MTYTVQQVIGPSGNNPYGPTKENYRWAVVFAEHPDKQIRWGRKGANPPQPGESTPEGRINWEDDFGPTFVRDNSKFAHQQQGVQAAPLSVGRERDPKTTAQIQRQHSQEMALRALALTGRFEGVDLFANAEVRERFKKEVSGLATFFDRDIAQGAQTALTASDYGKEPPRKDITPTGVSDIPQPPPQEFQHPAPAQNSTDSIPF